MRAAVAATMICGTFSWPVTWDTAMLVGLLMPPTRSRIATAIETPPQIPLFMAVPPSRSSSRRSAASGRDEIDLDDRAVEHDAGGRNDGHHRWIGDHPAVDALEAAIVRSVEQVDVGVDDVLERGATVLQELFEIAEDVFGLDLDVRAVVGHPRMDAVDRRLEVGGDLAGEEQPVTRADGRRKIHPAHAWVELRVVTNLFLLVLGVGDERDQIRRR